MNNATYHQLFSLYSVRLISSVNVLEKNIQARVTVTIYTGSDNANKVTCHELFSLHSVRFISGVTFLEKNTQAQLIVTFHSGAHNAN